MGERKHWPKQTALLVLACALAVLEIAVYAALAAAERRADAFSEPKELLIAGTADEICGITYRAPDGSVLSFKKEENLWSIDEENSALPDSLPGEALDQEKVRAFASGVTGIAVRARIDDPEDLGEYGLDDPFTEAEIRFEDGRACRLTISDTAAASGSVYVIRDGDASRVFACVPSLKNNFDRTLADFTDS